MAIDASAFAREQLQAFKLRMRIFHDVEDGELTRNLKASITAVAKLVGADSVDDALTELAFERARYVYHDALDEFQENYANEIETLYLENKIKAIGVVSDDAQEEYQE